MSEIRVHRIGDDLIMFSAPTEEAAVPRLAGLTVSEKRVAELACQGFSNAAIATLRRASPRTIANQLASVYDKLGVSGRRQLRAALERRG